MAEIEQGENGDQGRARSWLTRALSAPRDPAWIADGRIFPAWAPRSPVTGALDAFEWRVAADAPPPRLPIDLDGGDVAGEPPAERPMAPPPPLPMKAAVLPAVAAPRPAAAPPANEPVAPALPVLQAGGAPKGVRPMARAPDDPGPLSPDEEAEGDELIVFRPGHMA
jgi:HemY protein